MTTIGEPFLEIDSTESTNALAMRAASEGTAIPGTAWFAHEQTAGKGQRGRVWYSEPGKNLAMSILLEAPWTDPSSAFPLSAATALACMDALDEMRLDAACIKWPNDIYLGDRKLGGILIENLVRGTRWTYAVLGIGINVNQTHFDPSLPNPVSILQATAKEMPPVSLAKSICAKLEARLESLIQTDTAGTLLEFNERLYGRGRVMSFRREGSEFTAIPEKVMDDGRLVLSCPPPNRFLHGEVEWVLRMDA